MALPSLEVGLFMTMRTSVITLGSKLVFLLSGSPKSKSINQPLFLELSETPCAHQVSNFMMLTCNEGLIKTAVDNFMT